MYSLSQIDLAMLAQPGSLLGGERPKAAIEDAGELWIAKFSSQNESVYGKPLCWILHNKPELR
ncbi:HipA domain-containing protein [Nitrosomonas aestuarii]|uniref:HipA domain-containing protein n=1 Tax=Nitrosomonas aestuarii TaxID=52441 RepID=UPI0011135DB4|nr:HipA domain-containing protein [Nitrosomonas aestuarii]